MNSHPHKTRIGTKMGKEYREMYPKNDGIRILAESAIDLTSKLGPFPM